MANMSLLWRTPQLEAPLTHRQACSFLLGASNSNYANPISTQMAVGDGKGTQV